MSIKKLGLALAVSALASGANAALYLPGDDAGNTGGSSLLLAAYDSVATTTLYVDLNALQAGNRVHTFDQNANQSFDLSSVAAANSFSLSNVQWTIVAADSVFAGGACAGLTADFSACGATYMGTVSTLDTIPATALETSINSAISGVNNSMFLNVNGAINTGNGHSTTVSDGVVGQWTDVLNATDNFWDSIGATGETLAFSVIESTSSRIARGQPAPDTNGTSGYLAGMWTLNGNTLTYATAAVPVPAALWMFASGLVGLAGVARRRKQA